MKDHKNLNILQITQLQSCQDPVNCVNSENVAVTMPTNCDLVFWMRLYNRTFIKNKENQNRILTFANSKHDNKQLARNILCTQ